MADFNSPPLWWRAAYGLAFAMFSAAMAFTVPATSLRFVKSSLRLLDAMRPSAYGIYLLHYIFIIWLQYAVYDPPLPAGVKSAIVFTGTLSLSWGLTVAVAEDSAGGADDLRGLIGHPAQCPPSPKGRGLKQTYSLS